MAFFYFQKYINIIKISKDKKSLIKREENMNCWVVFKNGEYVSGTNRFGKPTHAKGLRDAWKFYDFNVAMCYVGLGYSLIQLM